ncbi:MAG: hypothetical protein Q8Q35_00840 [Nanoarchaeota archaeon]|nr:hypothetical protein [Nanoarchaeota archaeon]
MAKPKQDNSIHVRLDNPIQKRKDVLSTAINVVELLRDFEKIKIIRKEKLQEMEKLRETYTDIRKLYRSLNVNDMPYNLKELDKVQGVKKMPIMMPKNVKGKTKVSKVVVKEDYKRSPLDIQLDALRRKLETL